MVGSSEHGERFALSYAFSMFRRDDNGTPAAFYFEVAFASVVKNIGKLYPEGKSRKATD
jgi:hypothetical protein